MSECKKNVNVICVSTKHQWALELVTTVVVHSGSNWYLEILVFEERGKPEYPEKNLSEQGREPTTNSTQI